MKGLGSHRDLLGTDLDEVLEGFDRYPVEPSMSAEDETAAAVATVIGDIRVGTDIDKTRRVAARIVPTDAGDAYPRDRYRGRPRRGRILQATVDIEEIDLARRSLELGAKTLTTYREAAAAAKLPRIQREHIKATAMANLVESQRWIREILKRHRYEVPADIDDG